MQIATRPVTRRPTTKRVKLEDSPTNRKVPPKSIGNISIIDACLREDIFRPWFRDLSSWRVWFAFLRTMFGLPMDVEDRKIFKKYTKRKDPSGEQYDEAWLVCGRRGGKSQILAIIAVYIACLKDWTPYLNPGEKGTIAILACDRKQARVIFRYIEALLEHIPMLKSLVKRQTMESFELHNQVVIQVQTASLRSVRGFTLIACLLDEVAFWRSDDSTNPDFEILDALRPGMSTIPGAMLLAASSPYSRRGAMWATYKRCFGKDDPNVLVWQAPTWDMNPVVPQHIIDEAYERDPASARAEYGAEFRTDIENFITEEMLESVIDSGKVKRRFDPKYSYVGFVDPSGGSHDSFTMAIAHTDDQGIAVLDYVDERKPPFSPETVVKEYCAVLKQYGVSYVMGDRYGGLWPAERFINEGISYEPSTKRKSDIYLDFLPLVNMRECKLLDNKKMCNEFLDLERRQLRGGMESVDHPPGSHDDVANSVAGAIGLLTSMQPLEIW